MTFGGPNAGAVGELVNPDMKGNWTAAPLPQIDPANPVTIHYHFDFVVPDDSSPEERYVGWDFINFALGQPEPWFEATRLLQPRTELVDSPAAQAIPGMEVFLYDLEISRPLVPNTHSSELQAAIGRAVQRIILEGEDIQVSLDQAVQEHQQAVGG
jgi:ABC-type glycerol-3-phosphate transport system substrate-binding protein